MKGLLIFAGGVVTGAAATFGVLTVIAKKRQSKEPEVVDISRDGWEEVTFTEVPKEETVEEKKEEVQMDENINIDISNEHNKLVNSYVANNKEEEPKSTYPYCFMTKEEFEQSPYEKEYYTYFSSDGNLVDDVGNLVTDGRCGGAFVSQCLRNGVAYVCNEDLEVDFEITLDPLGTYEELQLSADDDFFYEE